MATDAPKLCLVTGATGYIGGRLVPELLAAGLRVRAMARHPDRLDGRPWREGIEVVAADDVDAVDDGDDDYWTSDVLASAGGPGAGIALLGGALLIAGVAVMTLRRRTGRS